MAKTYLQLTLEEARQLYQLGVPVQYSDTFLNTLHDEERWYSGSLIDATLGPRSRASYCLPDLSFRIEIE